MSDVEAVVRLHNPGWRAGCAALIALGLGVAAVGLWRWRDGGSALVDGFFVLVGLGLAGVGTLLTMSSVELRPGLVDVVNGLRRHRFHVAEVTGVSIAGFGDQRGAVEGVPPPRSTWCLRVDTARGHVLSAGLAANRRPSQRRRLEELVVEVARHCGLATTPT
ncbi:MAG TPA: hypothetical protein VJM33_03020 [Microthrixaceae bacterium]|nr:hypothetical protein [Microthrixaceae bacterium]